MSVATPFKIFQGLIMNNDIDAALLAAIQATATDEPKPKKITKSCQLVRVISDDNDAIYAMADRSLFIRFADVINCRGIGSAIHI
jgi:hypothetical protein